MRGQRVNNFRIVRLLGEGSMGAVYEAEHLLIHRKVAVKVLKPALAVDPVLVQRFLNEARATSAIRHPNIVEVVDVGLLPDGVPYLVMELLEGESLARRLERVGPLALPLALDFVRQAASALEAAHGTGIVHRDLKPDNLFLVPDARLVDRELVKVLDFGIAKLRPDVGASPVQTIAGALFGTPTYMSPEQCRGLSEVDQRADIYALGIILYESLCGKPPFSAMTLGDMMLQHVSDPPPPPSRHNVEVSPELERVILKALAKRPDERFASMAEFGAALGQERSAPRVLSLEATVPADSHRARLARADLFIPASSMPSALSVLKARAPGETPPPESNRRVGVRRVLLLGVASLALASGAWAIASLEMPRAASPQQASLEAAHHDKSGGAAQPRARADLSPASAPISPAPSAVLSRPEPRASTQPDLARAGSGPEQQDTELARGVAARSAARDEHGTRRQTSRVAQRLQTTAVPDARTPAEPAPPSSQAVAPALPPGYLSLDSAPWSEVYLGSSSLGTTPLIRVALPPGKHVLTLKNTELGASTSYVVEIKSGASLSRLVGWEK